jgi:antitoxin (DNA-binding transcriptional repressor) of toxin-antitoxin stability system
MDEVSATGEPVVITRKGKAVAKLVQPNAQADDIFGRLGNVMKIVGDIESHIVPLEDWGALR